MILPGVYGKLPAHGDFIQRNLPSNFVKAWDEWLQHFVAGSREKIGPDWLDMYLTSPIWRFALSEGVVDEDRWAGILMPSVDQVGRYFPFTVALKMPDNQNPFEFLSRQAFWYERIEELVLQALDGDLALDDLVEQLSDADLSTEAPYIATGVKAESYAMQVDMGFDGQPATAAYPYLLDALLAKVMSSYSVWSTTGSERVSPCLFASPALPSVSKLPAMIDGQWQQWQWQQPYFLQSVTGLDSVSEPE